MEKKNPGLSLALMMVMIPLLMAMGSMTGTTPGSVPKPAKPFRALFVDQMDVATEVREVTIEGNVFVEGKRGEGTYTVPFENIVKVEFLMRDGRLNGVISLKDGKTLELIVNKTHNAYGRTDFGTFQIRLGDLKMMTLNGPAR